MRKKTPPTVVFLDRDGTVVREVGYVNHPDRIELLPGAGSAIRSLNQKGIKVVIVSNQSGVARGYFPQTVVTESDRRMRRILSLQNAHVDKSYYCFHHLDGKIKKYRRNCSCRKPKDGLARKALKSLHLKHPRMFVVGDKETDVELAGILGAKSILVLTGYGLGIWKYTKRWKVRPSYVAKDLSNAVKWILLNLKSLR